MYTPLPMVPFCLRSHTRGDIFRGGLGVGSYSFLLIFFSFFFTFYISIIKNILHNNYKYLLTIDGQKEAGGYRFTSSLIAN